MLNCHIVMIKRSFPPLNHNTDFNLSGVMAKKVILVFGQQSAGIFPFGWLCPSSKLSRTNLFILWKDELVALPFTQFSDCSVFPSTTICGWLLPAAWLYCNKQDFPFSKGFHFISEFPTTTQIFRGPRKTVTSSYLTGLFFAEGSKLLISMWYFLPNQQVTIS